MTIVLALFNDSGVTLAADGLASFGMGGFGSQQLPTKKLTPIGSLFGCGMVGASNLANEAAQALVNSALARMSTPNLTAEECLTEARRAVSARCLAYLQNVVLPQGVPFAQSLGSGGVVFGGVGSDYSFATYIEWTGTAVLPDAPHYLAAGSGAATARNYLDAYSFVDVSVHPMLTLQALAVRVLERVAKMTMEIGGDISVLSLHRRPVAGQPSIESVDAGDAGVRAAIEHWELLEENIHETIVQFTAPR